MAAMPVNPLMPRTTDDWTVDDLEHLPEDGLRYELIDGTLLVSPSPIVDHQILLTGTFRVLDRACPPEFRVLVAPMDWQPDRRSSLEPDVLVMSRDDAGVKNLTLPLALAVEILSPSTRRRDLTLKFSKYQDSGVASYWVVDPDGPTLTAWDLHDGHYVEAASARGDETVTLQRPFAVTITPGALRD